MISGEGMPTHRDPFNKGKLIVLFNITYPEQLDPAVAKKLAALLPKPKVAPVPAGAEDVHLQVFDGKLGIMELRQLRHFLGCKNYFPCLKLVL